MYVITTLITKCEDEDVFFQVVNDKAVIELLCYCLMEQVQLNLPDKLVYMALLSIEIALNFSHFNNEDALNILDFKVKGYLQEISQNEAFNNCLAHSVKEISEKAI